MTQKEILDAAKEYFVLSKQYSDAVFKEGKDYYFTTIHKLSYGEEVWTYLVGEKEGNITFKLVSMKKKDIDR